jgi:hypothetical protein
MKTLKTTSYEEWNYIFITIRELIRIIISNWVKKFSQQKITLLRVFKNFK